MFAIGFGICRYLLLLLAFSTLLLPQTADDGQRREQALLNGQLQVPAGQRRALMFMTRSNFKNAHIAGNVSAQGGSGNGIRVSDAVTV